MAEDTMEAGSKLGMQWRDGKSAEVGSTHRIQQLNRLLHSHRPNVDIHRTRCFTSAYQATEGEPYLKRRYRASAETIRTLPVTIYPYDRIAGWQGERIRCEQVNIEMHADWLEDDLDEMRVRRFDPFEISDEDLEELRSVHIPYWRDKTLTAVWAKQVSQPQKLVGSGVADAVNYLGSNGSHFIPDNAGLLAAGFRGRYELAKEHLARIDRNDPADIERRIFYDGIIEVLEAIKLLGERYADKAHQMAEAETDAVRGRELAEIAEIMGRVPWNGATTFREAIQTVWMTLMLLYIEGAGPSITYGRFDQYMYPFYKADVEAGRLTAEQALEAIEELYIKTTNIPWFQSTQLAYYFGGYYRFSHLGVGGLDKHGQDASNELSYLCLRAMRHCRTTAPTVSLYLHDKTPDALLLEAAELSAEGMGHPSFFNVDTYSEMLKYRGGGLEGHSPYSREQILELGSPIGCVEPGVAGLQYGHTDSGILNLGAIVSLVMNDGVKPVGTPGWGSGKQCGPHTGDPRTFDTWEQFDDAVKTQLVFHIRELHEHLIVAEKIVTEQHQLPTFTICADGCIERGVDVSKGAFWNIGPTIQAVGLADIVNSMAAVRKVVYEDQAISMDELCRALDADFEGSEELRLQLRKAPKYGNDDDRADDIAAEMFQFFADTVRSLKMYRGAFCDPAIQMVQAHVGFGELTWALPSGRKAMRPLADTMSAEQQTDVNGPTAASRSYGKLNFPAFTNGTLLNMWISRSELVTQAFEEERP